MAEGEEQRLAKALAAMEHAFKAPTQADLDAIMQRAFADFGIVSFNVVQVLGEDRAAVGKVQYGKSHGDWGVHYVANHIQRVDGVLRVAKKSVSPIWWARTKDHPMLSKREQQLFDVSRAFGWKDGFVTPVHNTDGSFSMVTLITDGSLELSLVDQSTLRMLSLYYYSFSTALARNAAMTKLTERQRECLKWVSAGKTSWEISTILKISERTVLFHVSEACRRLGVQTRAQAVASATVQGLIGLNL
jgi:DNA-binding CsgD family transcriptional regulator